jgi:hypothetical protein
MTTPIQQLIYDTVVKPSLDSITYEANGKIMSVNYHEQTLDVRWADRHGGVHTSLGLSMPQDGNGIFKQSPKIGQRVKLGFINGSDFNPYISIIYNNESTRRDYYAKGAAGIPKGITYGIWG